MVIDGKPIILIGFMGVGKTVVGKALSEQLGRKWIDTDGKIEEQYQMEIANLFRYYGEKTFREMEKKVILQSIQQPSTIISTGGGAFLQREVRETCLANGFVIWLDISWKRWKRERWPLLFDRPLLKGKSEQEIKELFTARKTIYSAHHLKVDTDGLGIRKIVDFIVRALKEET